MTPFDGRRAHDADEVGAEAAVDLGRERRAGAEHEEAVVARAAVDGQRLDVHEADVQAGAEDAVVGDHEVVVELRADDDDRCRSRRRRRCSPAR
jgi:hypothetical protein